MVNFRTFVLVSFWMLSGCLFAQSPATLWFHSLSKEQNLSNNRVMEIFQDSEGFTWIASLSGLDRFDGHHLKHYKSIEGDATSLRDNFVTGHFFEDGRKDIWFCTNSAIHQYRRSYDNFSSYTLFDKNGLEISDSYAAVALEQDSIFWLRAGNLEIFRFNIRTPKQCGSIGQTSLEIDLIPGYDEHGRLNYLFATGASKSKGIEVLELEGHTRLRKKYVRFAGKIPDEQALNIHSVLYEQDSRIWLATASGLYKWNLLTDALTPFAGNTANTHQLVETGTEDLMVVKFGAGLFAFNKPKGAFTKVQTKLLNDPSFDLGTYLRTPYQDTKGNIWMTLDSEGLVYANPQKAKMSAIPKAALYNQSTNYEYRSIVQEQGGDIWCSTFNDGIFHLTPEGKVLQHYHPKNKASGFSLHKTIHHAFMDIDNNLWICGTYGIAGYDKTNDRFFQVLDTSGQEVPNASYVYQLRNKDILVSTLQSGIFRVSLKNEKPELIRLVAAQDITDYYTSIFEDDLGSIYIGHKYMDVRVFSYNKGELKQLTDLPVSGAINGFYETDSLLWIATSNGLEKVNKTRLSDEPYNFNEQDGLQSAQIQSMVADEAGTLWLGTANGLSVFDITSRQATNFSMADGIQSRQFYELAALSHQNGQIWLGGDKGITVVDPAAIQLLQHAPVIQLSDINVNDEELAGLADATSGATNVQCIADIQLPYQQNTLSFRFVAIDYSDPQSTLLAYQMEGYDKNWVFLSKGEPGFARYANLPPDTYRFKIRAANSDGVWSEKSKEIAITITPPWYQTWWARALLALLLALTLYTIYKIRINQIRKVEAFKRKETEYKLLVAESKTAVMRLQMNPHFIFNSMNSISSYILQKDIATANDYLNRFAKLMRMILKLAEKPFLAISQEIELLEQYLRTEAMRFEDTIAYDISVSDNIDPDEVVVPTMILQPFVENAIWHGLARKEGAKKIIIRFELHRHQLHCTVEDNGIGRAASTQHNSTSRSHESKAIEITQGRLRLIEEMENAATKLEIIDLKDESGQARGTRVEIRLPLL